jgi:asparagine synthase (glutamine-hydrolysing)
VLRAQPTLEASRGYCLPVLSPLMSQPIIETCLDVPSWEWRAGGRDRSLARRAFAGDLPPAVLDRRVKGTPSRFAARLLDHFRQAIRERLLDGRLAAERIIDSAALDQILAGDRPVPDLERVRILELVNCEAWIGHWDARRQALQSGEDVKPVDRGPIPASGGPIP